MLHILLLILKIIGIILLAVLGLILLLFILVLFVPVRYRGDGSFYGKPEGTVKISWLLRIFSLTVSYKEELDFKIRIFGIHMMRKQEEAAKAAARELEEDLILSAQELAEEIKDPLEEIFYDRPEPEPPVEQQAKAERPAETKGPKELPPLSKKGFFARLKERLKGLLDKLTRSCRHILRSVRKADNLRQEILDFMADERNKKTFRMMLGQIKRLLRHILPVKLKGQLAFGLEDPYLMGQILSGAALLYPVYHRQLSVKPVFDTKLIEGELFFKGRIRLAVLLSAGLRILLDKNFRVQLKKIRNRGGM